MNCIECLRVLDEYVDGELSHDLRSAVDLHIAECAACRHELARLQSLLADAASLPKWVGPDRDLWDGISSQIGKPVPDGVARTFMEGKHRTSAPLSQPVRNRRVPFGLKIGFAAAAVIVAIAGIRYLRFSSNNAWDIVRIQGKPALNSQTLIGEEKIRNGDLLQTDGTSRARINVGSIGRVEVEPNTRIRLLDTKSNNHRLALDRGAIVASTWAPPRMFFVETPSAVAVDLGCAYRLMVNESGSTTLLVTAGYVALQWNGRESIVPASTYCETRVGRGPGTPFSEHASPSLRTALERYDFEDGGAESLSRILAEAQRTDGVSLWHLLSRAEPELRPRLYDRLALLIPPPAGVTEEGILQLDRQMLSRWWAEFEPTPLP